jgi:hypothetical protein
VLPPPTTNPKYNKLISIIIFHHVVCLKLYLILIQHIVGENEFIEFYILLRASQIVITGTVSQGRY